LAHHVCVLFPQLLSVCTVEQLRVVFQPNENNNDDVALYVREHCHHN